jgi:hypothetical protein
VTYFLLFFTSSACVVSAVKLWRTGLSRRYRALIAYLVYSCLYSAGALVFFRDFHSKPYKLYWEICLPMSWVFSVWLILELYSLILEKHKGLASLGRWVQYAGFGLATLISVLVIAPQIQEGGHGSSGIVAYYLAIERGVDCGMLLFLVVILFWLTQYPVPLSRNVLVHSFVYTALFFANSLGMFAEMFFKLQLGQSAFTILTAIFALCPLAWAILLTPKGEEVRMRLLHFSAEDEERALETLESLNRTLLRVSHQ